MVIALKQIALNTVHYLLRTDAYIVSTDLIGVLFRIWCVK